MKLASIEKILEVKNHSNADKLDIVTVLGYQAIVGRDQWQVGDWCVFIQPDTVLPDVVWAAGYKAKSNRVKAIKLRGEWSFGIVEPLTILPWTVNQFAENLDGLEVSDDLGVTKYEAPMPNDLSAKGFLPFGIPKTDEERYQNLDLSEYLGKTVDITLKVDGQSFTAYWKDGQFGVCGRTLEFKPEADNHFTKNVKKLELEEKLAAYCRKYGVNIALRGEQYGSGIQSHAKNPHAKQSVGVQFFSSWDIDNQRYFDKNELHYYRNICIDLGLPMVPYFGGTLTVGDGYEEIKPCMDVTLTTSLIKNIEQASLLEGLPFEGAVIKGDGFSFKVISLEYDSRK